MINYIEGKIASRQENFLILELGGIGYHVNTSRKTLEESLQIDDIIRLYTSLVIRENEISLFGFSTESERQLFELLMTVTGIGPKLAIGILSSITPERFQEAILSENAVSLSGVKGVGKKTAERLIMELKEKISKVPIERTGAPIKTRREEMALRALTQTLGFGEREARKALDSARQEHGDLPTDQLIKQALSYLSKPR